MSLEPARSTWYSTKTPHGSTVGVRTRVVRAICIFKAPRSRKTAAKRETDRCPCSILGAAWGLAAINSSMLQENNLDAACMYQTFMCERTEWDSSAVSHWDWKQRQLLCASRAKTSCGEALTSCLQQVIAYFLRRADSTFFRLENTTSGRCSMACWLSATLSAFLRWAARKVRALLCTGLIALSCACGTYSTTCWLSELDVC